MPPVTPLIQPPMGHSGPASPPTANPGLQADAMSKMREAIKLIEMALPGFEIGSDGHKAAVDMLSKGTKAFPASEEVPGVQKTQLQGLAQQAQKSAMMQALLRSNAQGAGGAPGGAPPPGQPAPQPEAQGAM